MKHFLDTSAGQAVLQRMLNKGLLTVEDLDVPSPDYLYQLEQARRSSYFGPDYEPPIPYANLLRQSTTPEAVQPISPRDFDVAAATRANEMPRNVELPPLQWPPVPGERDASDLSGDQDPAADRADHGQDRHLATAWEHDPPSAGGDGTPALESEPAREPVSTAPW